jgi:hypothetical protein
VFHFGGLFEDTQDPFHPVPYSSACYAEVD